MNKQILSIRWRDREIVNTPTRYLAIGVAILAAPLILIAGVTLTIIMLCLTFPLHLLLRALGRQGFLTYDDGKVDYTLSTRAFERVVLP